MIQPERSGRMNKYDRERINMIIVMIMYITELSERKVFSYVKRTKTYLDILSGDELTLYDSYAANLMDMANEWKRKSNVPSVLRNITAEQINDSNKWLRVRKISDARQAKFILSKNHNIKRIPHRQKRPILQLAVKVPKRFKFRIARRSHKAPIATVETLYEDI